MENPLENIPLNTKKIYVMATTNQGCKIFMPADSYETIYLFKKRNELQKYLKANT